MARYRQGPCDTSRKAALVSGFSVQLKDGGYWEQPLPVELIFAQTTTVALAVISPVNPFMVAVIAVEPRSTPEVASPVALMVATPGAFDFQVTRSVMSRCEAGWLPCS